MRYLGEDEVTQMMGIGYLGEVRQGLDGNLYQWVEGYDGLGNPFGFWKKLKRLGRGLLKRALPFASRFAPFIPGVGPAVAAGLRVATPLLQRRRRRIRPMVRPTAPVMPGVAPSMPQAMPAMAAEAPAEAATAGWGLGEDEVTQMMGIGYLGEVRPGPDGNLYQWVEGYDGLGNPFGFWKKLKRLGRGLLKRALPFARRFAPFIPGVGPAVAAGLRVATPFLRQAGVAGYDGLGALYQAPDGTLYQVQGLAEDEELRGWALADFAEDEELRGWGLAEDEELRGFADFAEDEELRGWGLAEDEELRGFAEDEELRGFADFAEDEELQGFAEDEELRGFADFAEDEELRGFAEDEELRGFAEDEELRGLYGYVRENGVSGLDAFMPDQPTDTRWFKPPAQPPDMWRPLW